MRGLTLRQLRAVAAVAKHGTVTAAARALSVTPPAVTTQVHLFEEACGLALLDRIGDRFQPTEAGRAAIAAAASIEAVLDDFGETVAVLRGLKRGRVLVGVVSTAKYFAPQALGAFARLYPGVDVRLLVGNRETVIAALRSFEIDVAIMGRPPEDLALASARLGDHPHVVIAPPDHPLAGRRGLSPADLAGETFLVREPGSGTRTLMEALFAREDVAPKLGMEIGSNETIKQAVIAGLGIAFISGHTVAAELVDGRLVTLDVAGLPIMRTWYVVHRLEKRLLPAAEGLRAFLVSDGARFLPALPATP